MNPVEKCLSLANHCAALFLVKSANYGQLLQKVPLLTEETAKNLKNAIFYIHNNKSNNSFEKINYQELVKYAGFTSPVTRYSDFWVHRQIHAALVGEKTSIYESMKVA